MQNENHLKVCKNCLLAIWSREGNLEHKAIYVDEENAEESTCEWCEENGFSVLYELI